MLCPSCEEGKLAAAVYSDTFQYNGDPIQVGNLECYRCANCGEATFAPEQIRRNNARVADAKREADGLLTAAEIRQAREILQLSQHDAAIMFGGGQNAFSKYERGEVVQSASMDKLIRVALQFPIALAYLRSRAGFKSAVECEVIDIQVRQRNCKREHLFIVPAQQITVQIDVELSSPSSAKNDKLYKFPTAA